MQRETNDAIVASRYRIKRVGMLALAVVCALLGVFSLASNFGCATRSQQVATQYVQTQPVTDVLLVMSYDESDRNTPLARNGVLDVMDRSAVNVDVVYMDAYNAPINSTAYTNWVQQVQRKLENHGSYSAVICCDDEALYFVEYNHDAMFNGTPVVFFGINDINHAVHATTSGYMTGMIEQNYVGSMMQAAANLQPDATSFTAIVDDTPGGVGNRAQFDLAMQNFSDMDVRYVNASNLTRDELTTAVSRAQNNTIVFLLDANTDRNGNVFTLDNTVTQLTNASNVPVYRATIGGVGNGIAGSAFWDAEQDGRKAAEMTIKVLNGTRPSDIPLQTEGTVGYIFDGKVLADYGLSTTSVPAGSTVLNRSVFSLGTLLLLLAPVLLLVAAFLFARAARNAGRGVRAMAPVMASPTATTSSAAVASPEKVEVPIEVPATLEDPVGEPREEAREERLIDKAARKKKSKTDRKRRSTRRGQERQLRKSHPVESVAKERDEVSSMTSPVAEDEKAETDRNEELPVVEVDNVVAHDDDSPMNDEQDVAAAIAAARSLVGVEVLDLDEISDTYGARTSDESLRVIHKRLEGVENSSLIEAQDNRFLLGFDIDLNRGSQSLELIEFLVRQPLTVEDNTLTLRTCIGAVNRQKDMSDEDMRSSVDFTLKQAHELGQVNIIVFYDNNMRRAFMDRPQITELLKVAIENEDFIVFYQPQIDLRNNEVVGYEALVRLKNKAYPPSQFIPVAEVTGMIVDIDRIVTKRAVEQLSIWKRRNKRMRPVSINFSPVHLNHDEDFVEYLLGLFEKYDVPPEFIKLEITEGLLNCDQQRAEALLQGLFEAGVTIVLDNFGMGYSTFNDVMTVPASIIKIGREFVDTFLVDGADANFEQLVRLVHGLGRKVVVVGVDKKWQIDVCRELKCDVVQGYFFSKPLLPENAARFRPSA